MYPKMFGPKLYETGEWEWVANLRSDVFEQVRAGETKAVTAVIKGLEDAYGEQAVATGNAFDRVSGTASGVPNMVGVYVMKSALENAQH